MEENTFEAYLKEQLKDPEFRREWNCLQPYYEIAKAIYEGLDRLGWTDVQLAEASGISLPDIQRMIKIDTDYDPTLEQLLALAEALGYTLEIRFVPVDDMAEY
ncbi:MAG: helix-turn-helix domain-containing protein [Clostridia bacterium]|nr:helix-turn-helix domain-containing protein [Clostridia bacterium]